MVTGDMISETETYLGDGVYASFDGYQLWLRVTRENGDERIALEPNVFESLIRYRNSLKEKQR